MESTDSAGYASKRLHHDVYLYIILGSKSFRLCRNRLLEHDWKIMTCDLVILRLHVQRPSDFKARTLGAFGCGVGKWCFRSLQVVRSSLCGIERKREIKTFTLLRA